MLPFNECVEGIGTFGTRGQPPITGRSHAMAQA
jgi:hypothetical protein